MRAVILVGGEGRRLRPLTFTLPKPLLPVLNRPLIEYSLGLLKRHGIADVILAVSYMPDAVRDHLGDGRKLGMRIGYSVEHTPLGTGGGLKTAAAGIDTTFLAMNGDLITDADISGLIGFHRDRRAVATIAVRRVDDPADFGLVLTDGQMRVQGFLEKAPTDPTGRNLINAGVYVMEPAALDRVVAGEPRSVEREVFPDLIALGAPVFACPIAGYWIDLSTPDRLLQATRDLLDGMSSTHPCQGGRHDHWSGIRPPVCIGEGCRIAEGATVGPHAVLGDSVHVAAGAVIERSVLLKGTTVGEGARVSGALIGRECVIGPNARLGEGTVLGDNTRCFG